MWRLLRQSGTAAQGDTRATLTGRNPAWGLFTQNTACAPAVNKNPRDKHGMFVEGLKRMNHRGTENTEEFKTGRDNPYLFLLFAAMQKMKPASLAFPISKKRSANRRIVLFVPPVINSLQFPRFLVPHFVSNQRFPLLCALCVLSVSVVMLSETLPYGLIAHFAGVL